MESLLTALFAWFSLEGTGLATIFGVAFVSATLLPMGSEPVLATFVKLNPDQLWVAIAMATAGNTLGGVVTYWLGYGAHEAVARHRQTRYLGWLQRLGPKALFFSFLPIVGDPLCAVAGWLKLPFLQSAGWMALGKGLRYVLMTGGLLWLPDGWWEAMLPPYD